jgi:hypothetical protein
VPNRPVAPPRDDTRLPWPVLIVALLAVLLLVVLGLQDLKPPASAGADAPPQQFSAARALPLLQRIAHEPHPVGSVAGERVRDGLVESLRALGYAPRVQVGLGVGTEGAAAGNVSNVVMRIPGQVPGRALMLTAHYDSVPIGNGAADDGASVAAILETLRALKSAPPLRNDLIVVFSDGEEAGLLGAESFVANDPWAKDIGLVLNFEYRGDRGPMLLFETSPGNGRLVDAFAHVAHPVGSSLMYEIYRYLPNDTDLSVYKHAGLDGMNFAAMEGPTAYHTQMDRAEALDLGTMQHQGEIMLALARHFGDADLTHVASSDQVYFDLPGLGLVHYDVAFVWPMALFALALLVAVVTMGVRGAQLRAGRVVGAALLLPLAGLLVAIVCSVAWTAIRASQPHFKSFLDVFSSHWFWMAFACLGVGLYVPMQGVLRRGFDLMEQAVGAALLWTLMLLATARWAPGASFVFAVPLLPVLAGQLALLSPWGLRQSSRNRLGVSLVAGVPAVILLAAQLHTLFTALTTSAGAVPLFLLVLALGLFAPAVAAFRRRFMFPMLPFAAGIALLAVGIVSGRVTPTQPYANSLIYMQDGVAGQAMWLSTDAVLDDWTASILGASPTLRPVVEVFGAHSRPYWTGPAPALGLKAPEVTLLDDELSGDTRRIRVHVKSVRNAPEIKLFAEGAQVLSASLDGKTLFRTRHDDWLFALYNPPAEGVDLTLQVRAGMPFALRVIDSTYGLPATGLPPRAATMTVRPFGASDSMRAFTSVGFN